MQGWHLMKAFFLALVGDDANGMAYLKPQPVFPGLVSHTMFSPPFYAG